MSTYDPFETVRWMIDETADEMRRPNTRDAAGRTRPKPRSVREREQARLAVLCEVLWNAEGRIEPLEAVLARHAPEPISVAA